MVTHINFAVEDDLAERAKEIKNARDWSWPVYFEHATENFERKIEAESEPEGGDENVEE